MNDEKTGAAPPPSTPKKGLKNKLILTMISVGTLPLLLAMGLSYVQGNKSLQNVMGSSFQALAYETSTKLDYIMKEEFDEDIRLTTHPTILLKARAHSKITRDLTEDELKARFAEQEALWAKQDPGMDFLLYNTGSRVLRSFLREDTISNRTTHAMYITDARGVLLSSINHFPDYLSSHLPEFSMIMGNGKGFTYISHLFDIPEIEQHGFLVSFPIMDHDKSVVGVFHRVYRAKEFFSHLIEPILFGDTGHVMLINSKGVVIDCPILPTGHQLEETELVRSVTRHEANWAMTQGDGHGSKELSIIGFSPLDQTNVFKMKSTGDTWHTFAWQSSEELFAPMEKLFLWISAAGFISILLIVIMGSLASNHIVQPIRQVQTMAARIGRGEDVEPLKITTGDEIESLAKEINSMNAMLKISFSGLEDKVREKTKEVRYLQEYTESILMSVPDILVIFNDDLKIEYVNSAFETLTGVRGEDVIGKPLDAANLEYKDAWLSTLPGLKSYCNNGSKQASLPPGESGTAYRDVPRDPLAPQQPALTAQSTSILTLGSRSFAYQYFDVALTVEDKRRIGLLMKEISEEKALQEQLAMADKLSGLGTLAAGIAHEMNNPLYSIMGFTEAILEEKETSKIHSYAEKVLSRAKHMASIILNFAGYSRSSGSDSLQDVNVNERLDASLEMALLASYSDDIVTEKNYADVPLIPAKPEEIQQIFLNIFANAVQAMEGKGKLEISSQPLNGNIVTVIRDTGPGIPLEYLSKVFDPFFTTKEQGKGTGLGLNIVHRLVEKYGGQISVDSKVGEGTTFTVTFPYSE